MYFLKAKPITGLTATTLNNKITLVKLLYDRLRHIWNKFLKSLKSRSVFGKHNLGNFTFCEQCVTGKQVKFTFFSFGFHKSKHPIDYLHVDLHLVWF